VLETDNDELNICNGASAIIVRRYDRVLTGGLTEDVLPTIEDGCDVLGSKASS
jgi:hypothetical protein